MALTVAELREVLEYYDEKLPVVVEVDGYIVRDVNKDSIHPGTLMPETVPTASWVTPQGTYRRPIPGGSDMPEVGVLVIGRPEQQK